MRQLLVVLLLAGYAIGQQTYAPAIDAELYGQGTDGAAKISSIINNPGWVSPPANPPFCPTTGNNIGCTIDARGMTGSDLVFQSNPFHGPNVPVTLLLGAHTYVACVPWVSGQSGYTIIGVHSPGSSPGGTRIRAGTGADGCAGNFPNGASQLNFTWQHGLYPASGSPYAAIYNDCGDPTTDNPLGTADCFGGEVRDVQFDCSDSAGNPVSTCNFGYYSTASEERGGLHDVSIRQVATACGFWDRSAQIGPSFPGGGSGPAHFSLIDTTCTASTNSDLTVDGWVWEMNTTSVSFTGMANCSATGNPAASGLPTVYTTVTGTPPTSTPVSPAVITNAGHCLTPPTGCTINSAHPPGFSQATCTVSSVGGTGTNITSVTFGTGMNYPTASVPAGGPLILRSTITGTVISGVNHRMRYAIFSEGDRDTLIQHVHTERIGDTNPCPSVPPNSNLLRNTCGDTILHGLGTAPYTGGAYLSVNTTTGIGGCVHFGVGAGTANAPSSDYVALNVTREISNGCVIVDDNVLSSSNSPFTLATSDTPSHRRVAVYTGGQIFSRDNVIAPTIAANGCGGTLAAISNDNGNGAFTIDVGATPTAACTITLPQATSGWNCQATDLAPTSAAIFLQKQSGGSTTTAVITNYSDTATSPNYGAHDTLQVTCKPR